MTIIHPEEIKMRVLVTDLTNFISVSIVFLRRLSLGLAILFSVPLTASTQPQMAGGETDEHKGDISVVINKGTGAVSQTASAIDTPSYVREASSGYSTSSFLVNSPIDTPQESHSRTTSTTGTYIFPAFRERERAYFYDLIGPGAFLGAAVKATVDQTHPLNVAYPSDGYLSAESTLPMVSFPSGVKAQTGMQNGMPRPLGWD
jgi:hypothetical protein